MNHPNYWLGVAAYLLPTYRNDVIIPMGIASMLVQGLVFAWLYPKVFDTSPDAWVGSAVGFALLFGVFAWSFTTLPVAAKYRTASVKSFLVLETAFTALHFAIVAPLIALAFRGS